MKQSGHNHRYSEEEKQHILHYLEENTYKETSERFNVSEATLARWKKKIIQNIKVNKSKIIIGLSQYWLNYMNEQIANGIWRDYDDAVLQIIRFYDQEHKKPSLIITKEVFLQKINQKMEEIIEFNPGIDSIILTTNEKILFKTESWKTENITPLINSWDDSLQNKGTHTVKYNKKKYIFYPSQEQILFIHTSSLNTQQDFIPKNEDNTNNIYLNWEENKQNEKNSEQSVKKDVGKWIPSKEYLCGVKISIFNQFWYFFALIQKDELIPSDIITQFFKSIRSEFTIAKYTLSNT